MQISHPGEPIRSLVSATVSATHTKAVLFQAQVVGEGVTGQVIPKGAMILELSRSEAEWLQARLMDVLQSRSA